MDAEREDTGRKGEREHCEYQVGSQRIRKEAYEEKKSVHGRDGIRVRNHVGTGQHGPLAEVSDTFAEEGKVGEAKIRLNK
jgi:hypothetical protein